MNFKQIMRLLPNHQRQQIQNVINTLRLGGRSEKTIENCVHAIHRFLKYFQNKDISKFTETDIIEYIKASSFFSF